VLNIGFVVEAQKSSHISSVLAVSRCWTCDTTPTHITRKMLAIHLLTHTSQHTLWLVIKLTWDPPNLYETHVSRWRVWCPFLCLIGICSCLFILWTLQETKVFWCWF